MTEIHTYLLINYIYKLCTNMKFVLQCRKWKYEKIHFGNPALRKRVLVKTSLYSESSIHIRKTLRVCFLVVGNFSFMFLIFSHKFSSVSYKAVSYIKKTSKPFEAIFMLVFLKVPCLDPLYF